MISGIVYFLDIILEGSQNFSEITPRPQFPGVGVTKTNLRLSAKKIKQNVLSQLANAKASPNHNQSFC